MSTFSSVVLPEPLAPMTATISPCTRMEREVGERLDPVGIGKADVLSLDGRWSR